MRARSLLLSTVLYGSVVVATCIMQPGLARAAEALKPQGNWTVSKVEAKQPGAVPYCALTRRFGNGSVLTFARNPRDEGSLAIDFPKGAFETGKEVTIDLAAGSETRSFKTSPVSERSIIVRMGEDQKFHQALEKNGQLKVSIADKAFDFAMPDMRDGAQDLSACLGQSIEPAAGDSPKMQAMPAPAVEKQKIANATPPAKKDAMKMASSSTSQDAPAPDFSAGSGDLQSLKEENIRLRNALERERREFENRFQQTGENTSATAELAEKVRLLELENSTLKVKAGKAEPEKNAKAEKPVACEPVKDSKQADSAMTQEMSTLKQDNARLKSSLDEQMQRVAMLEKSSGEKSSKTSAKTDEAVTAQISSLKNEIARLEADNAVLKKTASAPKNDGDVVAGNVATVKQLKETQAQLAMVKAERDRLSSEIAGIKNVDADSRIRLSSDNWNLEQATQRFNEAEREIRRLGSAVEQERAKCMVEKKDLEYMLFDPKIATKEQISRLTTLEEELARAQQELENSGKNKAKTEALELKIKELESRITDMSQRNASYELQAKEYQVTQNRVQDLESKLAEATLKKVAVETQLNDASQKLASAAAGQSKDLEMAQTRVRELEGKLADAALKTIAVETQLSDANQKLASAAAGQGKDLEMAQARVRELEGKLADAALKTVAVETQLSDANQKLASAAAGQNKDLENTQIRLRELEGKLTESTQKAALAQTQLSTANQKLATASIETERLRQSLANTEQTQASQGDQKAMIDALRQEVSSLNTLITTMQSEKTAMAQQLAQIRPAAGGPAARPDTTYTRAISSPVGQVQAQPVAAPVYENASAPSASVNSRLMGVGDVETLLRQAGVQATSGVQKLDTPAGGGVAYRWQTQGLFGTAEQKGMNSPGQFDQFVRDYLNNTRSRCTGQFASVPAFEEAKGSKRISSYEIACVDNNTGNGASAALTFYSLDGTTFTTVAHEAVPESMDIAMDARDHITAAVRGN